MEKKPLKRCPFCEGEAKINRYEIAGKTYFVGQCTDCMNCGLFASSEYGAEQYWNARSAGEMQLAMKKENTGISKTLDELRAYVED